MKEMDKRKVVSKDQRKLSTKPIRQDHRPSEKRDTTRSSKAKNDSVKPRSTTEAAAESTTNTKLLNDSNTGSGKGTESSQVLEDVFIDDVVMDESNTSNEDSMGDKKDVASEVSSDSDSVNDSVSSQGGEVSDSCSQSALGKSEVTSNTIPLESSENTQVNGNLCDEKKEDDIPDQGNHDEEIVKPKVNEEEERNETDVVCQKMLEMETRIEKLEQELREVAALEIALYSVVPEHGSSSHKVHTPSRRICRLYIHACKNLSSKNRATIAKNTVSGLILIAKSCGNDVPRLTFWLSNTVVLREIVCQAFRISCQKRVDDNADENRIRSLVANKTPGNSKPKKQDMVPGLGDWQETQTFTGALEKVESWIFSRIVESIWWQTLTPTMQSLSSDTVTNSSHCINMWINAFQDAVKRLCPVRGEGHECGCLPMLAKKVMEQCLARLDVAMFNAILRESVHEIPTDPVSDPIVDSRVLPIPAGDLSFGSGAQLKNCVGNWTIWLQNMFGMDSNDRKRDNENKNEIDDKLIGDDHFLLLNSLSDLLMLPKDMLLDKSVRMEVCPQISLPLVKRILCNFTPDEFCPDHVSGAVLEALNTEHIIEHNVSKEPARCFPFSAAPVEYTPPSLASVATKIAEVGSGELQLSRSASSIQSKGYTSDEDLQELVSPLEIIVQKLTSSSGNLANENSCNLRYELLRQVWSA